MLIGVQNDHEHARLHTINFYGLSVQLNWWFNNVKTSCKLGIVLPIFSKMVFYFST